MTMPKTMPVQNLLRYISFKCKKVQKIFLLLWQNLKWKKYHLQMWKELTYKMGTLLLLVYPLTMFSFYIWQDISAKNWQMVFKNKIILHFKCQKPRTTDAQRGNSLLCTAENSIPIPNSSVRPKHILSATSAKFFRYLWFMPSLAVRSPWYNQCHQRILNS